MDNSTMNVNPQAIYDFAKAVDAYGANMVSVISQLRSKNSAMAAYFQGKQYDDLCNIIDELYSKMTKVKQELGELSKQARVKAEDAANVLGVRINK